MRHVPWSSLCATAADEIPTNNSRQSVSESSWLGYPARIRRSCDIGAPEQGGGRQTAPAIRSAGLGEGLKGKKNRLTGIPVPVIWKHSQYMRLVLVVAFSLVACHSWTPTDVPPPAQPLEGNPLQARVVLTDGTRILLTSPSMSGDTLFGLQHIRGVSES